MLATAGALSLAIVASALLGNQLLQTKSEKLVSLKLDNKILDEQRILLARAKQDVEKYSSLEQEAKAIVPQEKDQAATVREIVKIASRSGVNLSAIAFPASTLGSTSGSKPASGSTTKGKLTQVTPVKDIPGVYVMEINVQQQNTEAPTTYSNFINFLARLEKNRRTAQVTGISIEPVEDDPGKLNFSLVVNVYLKP